MENELSNKQIADALGSLLWPNTAIGNKVIIQAAIDALLATHEQEPHHYAVFEPERFGEGEGWKSCHPEYPGARPFFSRPVPYILPPLRETPYEEGYRMFRDGVLLSDTWSHCSQTNFDKLEDVLCGWNAAAKSEGVRFGDNNRSN